MRSIGLPEVLVLGGVLFLLGFALFLLVAALRWKQSRSVQRALIDKLSANELVSVLQTPHGERLMQSLSDAGPSPGLAILVSVQRGVVVIVSGLGLVLAAVVAHAPNVVLAIAMMMIFVGIGLLVGAFATYRLSKRWHLLEEKRGIDPMRQAN